jgi:hypothetical protein
MDELSTNEYTHVRASNRRCNNFSVNATNEWQMDCNVCTRKGPMCNYKDAQTYVQASSASYTTVHTGVQTLEGS